MSFKFNGFDSIEKELHRLGTRIDDVAPKMLEEAVPILAEEIKKRTPQRTGALKHSISTDKAKAMKLGGHYIKIRFKGYEVKQLKSGKVIKTPNILKARVAEFGKHGEGATPFILPAIKESQPKMIEKMQEVFNQQMEEK